MSKQLSPRAARYLDGCAVDDPVRVANDLIDRALALQDEGRFAEADELLSQADALIEGEES